MLLIACEGRKTYDAFGCELKEKNTAQIKPYIIINIIHHIDLLIYREFITENVEKS